MRIQVITNANGYGLSRDVQVVREALEPHHSVDFTAFDKPRKNHRYDWNIHLELLESAHFPSARVNAFIPNPEWFMPNWTGRMSGVDIVLAKTRHTQEIFQRLHKAVHFTGWTSPDTEHRVDYTRRQVVHFAGDSITKGTQQIIEAAAYIPHIPILVVSKQPIKTKAPDNVTVIQGKLGEEDFRSLQRAPIHLCPSSAEGFGHYINEARSMGAVIVTTDAAPMNELVTVDHGFLAPFCATYKMRMDTERRVCPDALAECISHAWDNVNEYGPTWGAVARRDYEQQRSEFTKAINELIQ